MGHIARRHATDRQAPGVGQAANPPAWENHTWLVWVSSFPPWVFHPSNELFGRPSSSSLLLLAWVRAKRRMLRPPKKRKLYDTSMVEVVGPLPTYPERLQTCVGP